MVQECLRSAEGKEGDGSALMGDGGGAGLSGEGAVQQDHGGANLVRRRVVLMRLLLSIPVSICALLSCGALSQQLPLGTVCRGHCAGGGRRVAGVGDVPFVGGVGGGVVRNALGCGCKFKKRKKREKKPEKSCGSFFTRRDSGLNDGRCRCVNMFMATARDRGEAKPTGPAGPSCNSGG